MNNKSITSSNQIKINKEYIYVVKCVIKHNNLLHSDWVIKKDLRNYLYKKNVESRDFMLNMEGSKIT